MSRAIRVLIAGEGSNELGSAMAEADRRGVIDAFILKVTDSEVDVWKRVLWKDVTKLRPNSPGQGEARNVLGLALKAREWGCHALVFLRDRDGSVHRERSIQKAISEAEKINSSLRIAGGVPVEMLEAWLLALKGVVDTEADQDPKQTLARNHGVATTNAKVQLVQNAKLHLVPTDAHSLRSWLRTLSLALRMRVPNWLK